MSGDTCSRRSGDACPPQSGDTGSPRSGDACPPQSGDTGSPRSGGTCPPLPLQPMLYVYEADGGDGHGVCGVTDAFGTAERHLVAALLTMPHGASGSIRLAFLDTTMSPYPSYRYSPVIARAWHDAQTRTPRVGTDVVTTDVVTTDVVTTDVVTTANTDVTGCTPRGRGAGKRPTR